MKGSASMLVAACCLSLLATLACEEDGGDKGGDPCAEAAAIRTEAVTALCADKTDNCCYCLCWEDFGGLFDAAALYTGAVCECVIAGAAPFECVGETLDDASHCVGDEDSCAEVATSVAEALCNDSAI